MRPWLINFSEELEKSAGADADGNLTVANFTGQLRLGTEKKSTKYVHYEWTNAAFGIILIGQASFHTAMANGAQLSTALSILAGFRHEAHVLLSLHPVGCGTIRR
jgi:hypothetical protein